METVSSIPPFSLKQERKCLSAVTSFKAMNSISNITDKNNSFSNTTPGNWLSPGSEGTVIASNNFLELRSQTKLTYMLNKLENKELLFINDFFLSSLDTFKNEVSGNFKKAKYDDAEDNIFRKQIT